MLAGSVTLGLALVLTSVHPVIQATLTPAVAALLLASAALLLLTLPAMYAMQARAAGPLGLLGYVLVELGLLLLVLISGTPLLHPEQNGPIAEHPVVFALGIALTLGLLLTAIATYRADVLPRPAAVVMLAAMAGFFFVFFVAEFLPPAAGQVGTAVFGLSLALGLAWIGLAMWRWPST
jgi:hypothetical protein